MASNSQSSTKCYSAVLRRLLCSGSLPTHPSDQFVDPPAEKIVKPEENVSSNPGVVARLMGLDSFPNTPLAEKGNTLGSFFRSRSVNSIDFVSHFDPVKRHRRVRTSVSFREGIHYQFRDSLEKVDETGSGGGDGEKGNKKEKRGGSENSGKLRDGKAIRKPSKRVEIEEHRTRAQKKNLHGKKPAERLKEKRPVTKTVKSKEEIMPSKCLKKRQNRILARKVHPEGIVPEVARGASSRQNLPSPTAQTQSSYSNNAHFRNVELRAIAKRKKERKSKNNESCYYKRMVEVICGLTEESVKEKWVNEDFDMAFMKFYDFEEICKQFGQEILEGLLVQFVDELVRRPTLSDKD